MNKNNFRFFGIFVFVTIILSLYFVLATLTTVTLVTPAAGDVVNGTSYTFNATITGTSADNVTFSHNQSGSFVQFCVNTSAGAGPFTCINNTENLPDGTYYFEAKAKNDTDTVTDVSADVIVDNNDPIVSYISPTPADNAASSLTSIFVNVSVTEVNEDTITFELYNSTSLVNSTSFTNAARTINFTGLTVNLAYRYNVTVNDSATNSFTVVTRTFNSDNIAPSLGLTKTTSGQTSLKLSISGKEGTCTVDRSGATISGSVLTEKSLSCGKSYSYTLTCTDSAGNAGSVIKSFSTTGCSSSGVIPPKPKKASYSFSKITPGVVTILKNFDAEFGIKEIKIEVNNPAQSVSITITKEDGKPAAVSVEKSGKVYKYLQIETTNLADNFGKATV
ncbi:MAG: hypothetical protein IIA85_03125, partial [Nanoarchaeota archaeon]|nr:hypothetical protein [Nanoarchaeota archaeon]